MQSRQRPARVDTKQFRIICLDFYAIFRNRARKYGITIGEPTRVVSPVCRAAICLGGRSWVSTSCAVHGGFEIQRPKMVYELRVNLVQKLFVN
jgi:hypothetical protein